MMDPEGENFLGLYVDEKDKSQSLTSATTSSPTPRGGVKPFNLTCYRPKQQQHSVPAPNNTKIVVSHLSENCTESALLAYFGRYGAIVCVRIGHTASDGRMALIQFANWSNASLAVAVNPKQCKWAATQGESPAKNGSPSKNSDYRSLTAADRSFFFPSTSRSMGNRPNVRKQFFPDNFQQEQCSRSAGRSVSNVSVAAKRRFLYSSSDDDFEEKAVHQPRVGRIPEKAKTAQMRRSRSKTPKRGPNSTGEGPFLPPPSSSLPSSSSSSLGLESSSASATEENRQKVNEATRESMLDAQVKRQQLQQGKPFFPNMDPAIMSAMIDTNMPAGGDPPSRHFRTGASDFDAPLSSLDPAIRAAMMDTNMPMPTCGTSMLPPSRHHRTASRDFDPPLPSAVGSPTTSLDTGYDPEHDPLGLNTVQIPFPTKVGDPLMEENGDGVVEQQHRPDIDDDAAFGFGAGGAVDDDDFGGDGGDTFNNDANVGKENVVIQRQAFPPGRASPTPAFSICGFGGGDDNRDTGRQFQQAHQHRASPPPQFPSNANLVAEPTTSFGTDEQQLQHRHLSPALSEEADSDPWKTMSLVVWRGLFVLNRRTSFNCTCTAVSGGLAVFKAGREMVGGGGGDAGRIHLIGRPESRDVWEEGMRQLRDSMARQVCLMIINRPEDEHDLVTYVKCFERYNQGRQVGVLDIDNYPTIKDGYVFTLSSGEALPAELLPLDGAGLPEWAKHNESIVLVLIRRMDHEDRQWKRRYVSGDSPPPTPPLPPPPNQGGTRKEKKMLHKKY